MKTRSMLGALPMSLLILGGCHLPPSAVQAPPPPPAAPLETVPAQPGPTPTCGCPEPTRGSPPRRTYVWVPGHWTVPPQGYVWVPGHWETQANGTVWVDGQWHHN